MIDAGDVRRGRIAVSLVFLLYGMVLGTWTARIPAIKRGLGLSDGRLSIGLLAFAAGAIIGMQVMGRLVDRYGSARLMIAMAYADAALLILPAIARSLPVLAAALFGFGAVHGTLNIAMNANAVEVERARKRPTITSCHAIYSVGGAAGAAIGGLFAHARVGPAWTFVTVAAIGAALATWAASWAWRQEP